MKKVFLAVLAIAAMMVSCAKEALVDNQKETPEVEVNEPQPVILGSNLFKAPTTKASVDNIGGWREDMENEGGIIDKFIYVWALNQNDDASIDYPNPDTPDAISKVFIKNVGATLAEATGDTPDTGKLGSLILKNVDGNPFYYGTKDKDKYYFYAYYLGYAQEEPVGNYFTEGTITVPDVQINGDNDIMTATTDKAADAVVVDGDGNSTMVNPKYLYSQYSARHGVTPNLVFKHQLSKFTFYVQYAGETECDIDLMNITFRNVSKSGKIILSEAEEKFEANEENKGSIILGNEESAQPLITGLPKKNGTEDSYGESVGCLMVAPPVGSPEQQFYDIIINLRQMIGDDVRSFNNEKKIVPGDVKDDAGQSLLLTSFEAGKNYNVYITVYGLEEVKVNVELTEWENAGNIYIDKDAEITDGIMKQVTATYSGSYATEGSNCTLYALNFDVEDDIYCAFAGKKLVKAPAGTYTVTGTEGDLSEGTIITVNSEGKIETKS